MENKHGHLTFESENLAVPEIHTHELEEAKMTDESENKKDHIDFDNLAMPEIHFSKKKN